MVGIKNEHYFRVKIPFTISFNDTDNIEDNINNWNECCAKAIELFGLPGEKYICRFNKEHIDFWFCDEKDALVFELCCG